MSDCEVNGRPENPNQHPPPLGARRRSATLGSPAAYRTSRCLHHRLPNRPKPNLWLNPQTDVGAAAGAQPKDAANDVDRILHRRKKPPQQTDVGAVAGAQTKDAAGDLYRMGQGQGSLPPDMGNKLGVRLTLLRDGGDWFDMSDLLKASAEVLGSGTFGSTYKAALNSGKQAFLGTGALIISSPGFQTGSGALTTLADEEDELGGKRTKDGEKLRFLVVGDWGRKGDFNQSDVAFQMGRIGEELDIEFVVSTGDNFYDNGLTNDIDPAFAESFTNIYTAKSLQKQWFSVLGNHDYRGDTVAQMSPSLRKIDRRWLCLRSFVVHTEIAELFFVDTTPFVEDYFTNPEEHTYDWRGVVPKRRYTDHTLKDLESALKKSRAKWRIVVGHHAIRSVGHHGDTPELVNHLLPILQAYNVDFYMNGHDHCLEQISDHTSPIQFLTSGAGSKAWRGDLKNLNEEALKFFYDGQGFMSVQLTKSNAEIVFYDVLGRALHRWTRSKELHSDI
ncbi:purple acid phosphatase 17 [Phtheirospermum japonicum]|uniref:acid phosphatase n=1 Tax=Phtheirospermum japonicum TaxID=374723 RepID=A0A830CBE9_9LAMI|nr:purple acid phosphatase 17 [Phtheirospermum japonicum]